jgi:hypothetical protein
LLQFMVCDMAADNFAVKMRASSFLHPIACITLSVEISSSARNMKNMQEKYIVS